MVDSGARSYCETVGVNRAIFQESGEVERELGEGRKLQGKLVLGSKHETFWHCWPHFLWADSKVLQLVSTGQSP